MPEIPADILARLQAAEDKLAAATAKDNAHDATALALREADEAESQAKHDALAAHQEATAAASDLVAAVRAHFGLPVIDPLPPPPAG